MIDPTTPNLEAWRCSPSASTLQKFWNLCLQELSISGIQVFQFPLGLKMILQVYGLLYIFDCLYKE